MRKRFDDIFSALMLAAAVAVVLAGYWVLSHSISRAGSGKEAIPVAEIHIEAPRLELEPASEPFPEPAPAPDQYDPAIPLAPDLQAALREACAEAEVPVALALGVIQVESNFQEDAVSPAGCYGLMQLNPRYFPDKLPPADNLRHGVRYLAELLARHEDTAAALTAYNAGHDTGARGYANAVLEAAEGWGGR